jgi:hypothetical protein
VEYQLEFDIYDDQLYSFKKLYINKNYNLQNIGTFFLDEKNPDY